MKVIKSDCPKGLTPREIVAELDRYVIGQATAKKKVAIALRHRALRHLVDESLRYEISPKNILMIGPTGVGKTEIIRRIAKMLDAPFVKVEATKFTEVGYVGRDVESIIRDLVDHAFKKEKEKALEHCGQIALEKAYDIILDKLVGPCDEDSPDALNLRKKFKEQLIRGELDDKEIDVDLSQKALDIEIMAPPGMEDMTSQLQNAFQNIGSQKKKTKTVKIPEAIKLLKEEESHELIDEEDIKSKAIKAVEDSGIVFIDEIDKVCQNSEARSGDVSREGVQRDLLPLIEGTTVSTRYGSIKTDHILFVTSGAFHLSKPSDLIPELQGRLPIRVELNSLTQQDFVSILKDTDASLITQYQALLEVEGVTLSFSDDGIEKIAQSAWDVNDQSENIGARRLHTVLEKLLEDIFFTAPDNQESITIDADKVSDALGELVQDRDLSQFIL